MTRIRHSSFVTGHLSLVTCHWSLVIGHWSLVTGHWSLAHSLGRHDPWRGQVTNDK